MKAKIFVIESFNQVNEVVEMIKKEFSDFGPFKLLNAFDAWSIVKKRSKYVYYKNEIDDRIKSLIIETTNGFHYEHFFNVKEDENGEYTFPISVKRPMIKPLELDVNLFFISLGYPKHAIGLSFHERFDIVKFDLIDDYHREVAKLGT